MHNELLFVDVAQCEQDLKSVNCQGLINVFLLTEWNIKPKTLSYTTRLETVKKGNKNIGEIFL